MIATWPYIDDSHITQVDPARPATQVPTEAVQGSSYLPGIAIHQVPFGGHGERLDAPPRQNTSTHASSGSHHRVESADIAWPSLDPSVFPDDEGGFDLFGGDPLPSEPTYLSHDREYYHVRTQLADGRQSIIIDPGSVGNLCGDRWAKAVAQEAAKNGYTPSYERRDRPLSVSGVGHGSQKAPYNCKLPIALQPLAGKRPVIGSVKIPAVTDSDLPGLLGLVSLMKNRAVLDFNTLTLYFLGPGDYKLEEALPPGTDSFKCEQAPSGHLVLPCCSFKKDEKPREDEQPLTLLARSPPPGLDSKSRCYQ